MDHGGVPATGNDADQSPRFYEPSIDHLLGEPCQLLRAPPLVRTREQVEIPRKLLVVSSRRLKMVRTAFVVVCTLSAIHFEECSELLKVVFTVKETS